MMRGAKRNAISLLRRLRRCRRGSAMVEFVLVVPALVLLFGGVIEATNLLRLDRKLQNAAHATADLITQNPTLSNAQLANILTAADLVMQPFAPDGLALGISSVVFDPDDGDPQVDWTESQRGGDVPDAETLAAGLGPPGQSVVIVRATYQYTPVLGDLIFGSIPLEEKAFTRPRRSSTVVRN